jgi:pimeloyl-ACP methyl ester carboxylesterase
VVETLSGALGLQEVVLAGHSLGGAIALWLALKSRLNIRGLILMGTAARLPVGDVLLGGSIASLERAAAFIVEHGFAGAAEETKELMRQAIVATGETTTFGDFLACARFDIRPHLAVITSPALVFVGTADRLIQPRFMEALARELPNGRPARLEEAGHFVMLDRPAETADIAQRFLVAQVS